MLICKYIDVRCKKGEIQMKKKSILCLLIAFSLLIMPGNGIAANGSNEKSTEIVLGDTVLETTDYNKSDICISRDLSQKNEGIVTVTINDKETGKILEVISEEKQSKSNLNNSVKRSSLLGGYHYIYNIRRTCQEGPVTIFLDCTVYMHDSGFYTQIDEVLGTNMYIASSSDSTLENVISHWSVPNDVFPTAEVNFYGSGIITGKSINKPIIMSGSFYSYSSAH
jgi:hypothetical protein